MKGFELDRSRIDVGALRDEPDDLSYWLGRPPGDRLAAIEFLRRQFYPYGEARQQFRRFFEIAECSWR